MRAAPADAQRNICCPAPTFLATDAKEDQRPPRPGAGPAESLGQLDDSCRPWSIIVRPIVDAIVWWLRAPTKGFDAPTPTDTDVIHMNGENDVLILELRVGALENANDIGDRCGNTLRIEPHCKFGQVAQSRNTVSTRGAQVQTRCSEYILDDA